MHRVQDQYSSFTSKSSENICSNSGGAKEKGSQGETEFTTKTEAPAAPTLECECFLFFESHPSYDQTQGSSVVVLTL
jgi:hypothetical protein